MKTLFNRPFAVALALCQVLEAPGILSGQTRVEGYVFENNNRGFLNEAKVDVFYWPSSQPVASTFTNPDGQFVFSLQPGRYLVRTAKDLFEERRDTITVAQTGLFLKMPMQRRPGYLLDVTLADAREDDNVVVDAITGATIEIYNRTRDTVEWVLDQHPEAFFRFNLEQGNHYTILIRKPGYLAKRVEVFVNVEDCILCLHGLDDMKPGVSENLTGGNTMGTLLANIGLERATMNKKIGLNNIYYDFDKWDIRPEAATELDKVVQLLLDNPDISVELGSHTDARGDNEYNAQLSQKRAESAVAYIVQGGVDTSRITARGYGETQPVNACTDGVTCTDEQHAANRRTELRITGISPDALERRRWRSLEDMIREEQKKQPTTQNK